MKSIIDICKMTQMELKLYLTEFLVENGYEAISEDGYLYAKGTEPVLLVAHLDTIHKKMPGKITEIGDILSARNGIGGDDRCGVYIIMNIVKELKCSVLFCEDEESGTIGANKFVKSNHVKHIDANYMIEFDRKGSDDAVFYHCDNINFTEFILNTTGYTERYGTHTDICVIAPVIKLAAVNLSCGYYKAHTEGEYIAVKEMMNTIEVAKKLIKTPSEKYEYVPSKYVAPKPSTYLWNRGRKYESAYNRGYYDDYGYPYSSQKKSTKKANSYSDLTLTMTFCYVNQYGEEVWSAHSGSTKAECYAKFFLDHPSICMDDVLDYSIE